MSNSKSLTTLITELEEENRSLKRLEKIANQYVRSEFGCSTKELHKKLKKLDAIEKKLAAQKLSQSQEGQHLQIRRSESAV